MNIPFFKGCIKQTFACSEFTVHMQNQLQTDSFVGAKVRFLHDVPIFPYAHAPTLKISRLSH